MDQWAGVVLAAGDGVRMRSRVAKVLHRVCGKELVRYPVDLMNQLGISRVVVVVSPTNGEAICSRMALAGRSIPAIITRVSILEIQSRGELEWMVVMLPS